MVDLGCMMDLSDLDLLYDCQAEGVSHSHEDSSQGDQAPTC